MIVMEPARLLLGHGDLPGVRRPLWTTLRADHTHHVQRMQGRARYEDTLRIASSIRRIDKKPFGWGLAEIIEHHAFQHVIVAEFQANPQASGPWPGGKSLPSSVGLTEVAYKIDRLDLFEVECHHVTRGIQQFELAANDEFRRYIALQAV